MREMLLICTAHHSRVPFTIERIRVDNRSEEFKTFCNSIGIEVVWWNDFLPQSL